MLEELGNERRIHYSLDRFQEALKSLGHPERTVSALMVAGTNGKGTTSLLLSSALMYAGHHVGTYLSPHLQSPTERFLENMQPIPSDEFCSLALEYESAAREFNLTYFEYLALLNFVWAKEKKFDFMVLEVGLGGRLDATNVTWPVASIITNIALDHQQYLGHTLTEILYEKLGIVHPSGLLFTGIDDKDLLEQLFRRCEALDAIYYLSKEIPRSRSDISFDGQKAKIGPITCDLSNPTRGTLENAALALLVLRIIFPKIPLATIQKAFSAVATPGRMEVVSSNPRIVLSGDHNPAGIRCLLETLETLKPEKLRTLCAFSPDKPYLEMFEALNDVSDEIILTEIGRYKGQMPKDYYSIEPFVEDPRAALRTLEQRTQPGELLLVTGSLYLVGELRPIWRKEVRFLKETGK
ncbi:MAG: hypothetical protein HY537_03940 [Deltaproteobacteria bacterium]|nr:hypothetical protein [Deltaproteobacteria bacterium]